MRIVARRTLRRFVASLSGRADQQAVETSLDSWYDLVRKTFWSNTSDVKRMFANASIVGAERVVFNIKGNSYRLVAAVDFERSTVWIKWIGSHAEYDEIDVRKVEYDG